MTGRKQPHDDAPHLATARKWRPQVFGDIIGQSHITTTLRNAVATGRLSHAYLFSGPRGVGKTTTARILARAVNCVSPENSDPDNTCDLCVEIAGGRSVNVFEIDGASNRGVEEIRNLREAVRYGPGRGRFKVYIIDEVHMLTKEAFNALLKTLEEPPPFVIFIFATTEVHRVPLTILSRCQRFEFHRISPGEISSSLAEIAAKEKINIDDDALELIARRADGSLRDSQSIFDQVVSFSDGKIRVEDVRSLLRIVDDEFYFRVTDAVAAKDAGAGFAIVDEVSRSGVNLREFAGGITEHFRNLLVVTTTGGTSLVEGSERLRKRYAETASRFSGEDLLRLMKISSDAEAAMKWSQQPRLKLELGLLLMIRMEPAAQIGALLERIDALKKKVEDFPEPRGRLNPGAATLAAPTVIVATATALPNARTRSTAVAHDSLAPLAVESPAPLRGSVRASQPTLRPDQVVPPGGGASVITTLMQQGPDLSSDVRAGAVPIPSQPMPFSGPEASGTWRSLVEQVRREKIGIGTMLGETAFHAARGNNVSISCPDDFHADLLKRNRHYISSIAERLYGAKLQFDTILADTLPVHPAENPGGDTGRPGTGGRVSQYTPPGQDLRDHPLVRALISEFGAEEIH